jgi:pectin methylesterase-like acyl-CoA thioesterase
MSLLVVVFFFQLSVKAEEKLLYTTTFQDWSAISASTTEQTVNLTTDFSKESFTFTLFQSSSVPTGTQTKFTSVTENIGYLQTAKTPGTSVTPYILVSPLKSVTKVVFTAAATGNNRGFKVWKKNTTDTDWVLLSKVIPTPASGQISTININESNVALKFTPSDSANNSYMCDLNIYGDYTTASPQKLTTLVNIDNAGTIVRTPNSDTYAKGSEVSLLCVPNFGYKFVKWLDSLGVDLSTVNPLTITMDTTKKVTAVFEAVNTYTFDFSIQGSQWGEISLSPSPINGKYEEGTVVTMSVVPNAVTNFSYWDDNSTATERVITMDGNKTLTATFDEIPFIVGWNFKAQTPTSSRSGDFYSETTNTGLISSYEPTGTPVGWLASAGAFSPSYPCARLWTSGSVFSTTRRYLKANFSTVGYKNIIVKSMVSANYQAYSVMTLLYSLDDITYTELARVDITDVYNSGWKDLNDTLPAEAEGKDKIYLKWIGDATSTLLGNSTDNDGSAFTNIYVYADKEVTVDTVPPVLLSTVPVQASATASVTGAIVLTFNEKLKTGTGNITLNSSVISGTYGSKTVTFKYERLAYNTEYTLTVPAGALTDLSGNPCAAITLTFKTAIRTEPIKKLFDAVVAKDGTGDYTTVLDAIAAAPTNSAAPWIIFIKNGKYTGHHDIPSTKPYIHLIGQNVDSVIISDNRLCGDAGTGNTIYNVQTGATMVVNSASCYFENITFENSWGYEKQAGPQALALYTLNDKIAMKNCNLRSYQDTYLSSYNNVADRHYLQNCRIEGAVDFIYGGGDVFFDNCNIVCTRKDGGYIVAPSHKTGTAWGYVFSNCTIDEAHATGVTTYFGRPWQNAPKTVFLNTKLKASVYPVGWYYSMGAIPAVFADYGTMDANGNPVDLSQRISEYVYYTDNDGDGVKDTITGTAKNKLTDAEAATYTYENVILRSGDTWDPRMIAEAPDKPSNVFVNSFTITWDSVKYSRLYIILRNDTVIGFSTDLQYNDTSAVTGHSYVYKVQSVSEYGALSEMTTATETSQKFAQTISISSVGSKVYGDAPFAIVATVAPNSSNALNYELLSGPTSVANNTVTLTGAGEVKVKVSQAGNAVYLPAADTIIFSVTKASLLISADSKTKVYGAVNPKLTYTVSGLVGTDALASVSTSCNGINAGTYPINISNVVFSSGSASNYEIQYAGSELQITQAPLNVIANDASMTAEDQLPAFSYHFAGFVNGDDSLVIAGAPAFETTATSSSAEGTYDIIISKGSLYSENYSFGFTNAKLTVKPKVITGVDNAKMNFSIFPNPVTGGVLSVSAGLTVSNVQLSIISVTGTVVYEQKGLTLPADIDVVGLTKGIYFLKIKSIYGLTVLQLTKE